MMEGTDVSVESSLDDRLVLMNAHQAKVTSESQVRSSERPGARNRRHEREHSRARPRLLRQSASWKTPCRQPMRLNESVQREDC
jgi:hypothetical protein